MLDEVIKMNESMSEEWGKWLESEKSNIETLEKRIENLSLNHGGTGEFQYREFWADADEIDGMFKTLSPLPEEDKERLWAKYTRICREIKKRQEQEWQTRRAYSKQKRDSIEEKIKEAYSCANSAPEDTEILSRAQALLSEALTWLKDGGKSSDPADETPDKGGLLREDRQACWDKWREANDSIFSQRRAIWDRNYEQIHPEASAALNEANNGDPFQALDKIKEAQSRLKDLPVSRSQREQIRETLNSAWEIGTAKVTEIREEKKRKFEDWRKRMGIQIERWSNLIQQNKEEASELEGQIKRLMDQTKITRSGEHTETLRNWMAEKRQKIREINEINGDLEEKIQAAKEKLSS